MLPEVSHFIACKNYEEKITAIHTSKSYYDVISRQQESNQQGQTDKRVLVVDGGYDVNLTIKLVLEENGFEFNSQALENFTTGLYDLVILDVKMPAMSGFSLYEKICYSTAVDGISYEDLKKCYPNIDEICIHKPVDNDSLLGQIKSIL